VPDNGRKKLLGLVAGGAALLIVFVVVMVIVLGGSGGDSTADDGGGTTQVADGSGAGGATTEPTMDTADRDTGAAPTQDAVVGTGEQDTEAAPQEDTASEAPATQPTSSVEVTITLKGLPPGARATFEGRAVTTPFKVTRSNEPGTLKVTAPGHIPFKAMVSRDKDRGVTVKMRKRGGGSGQKGGKKPPGWKPNPFDD
jgi:hypothetical protein